jgi:hypothetical protein
MDIQIILAALHEERQQVNDVILSLERLSRALQGRKNVPTATSRHGFEGDKRTRTVTTGTRAKNVQVSRKRSASTKEKVAGM